MKERLRRLYRKEMFDPSFLGLWINHFFLIKRGLLAGIKMYSGHLSGGKLLDVGCGSKPYRSFFSVEEYVGMDIEINRHAHSNEDIDVYYDGRHIPFEDEFFDNVFSSEVFEHVFNLEELLGEINRVTKMEGKLLITLPFVWDEHGTPYDFARYTSFGIAHLLNQNGFEIISSRKSTSYFETVCQMLSAYISQVLLPRNAFLRFGLGLFTVAPINILGYLLGKVLPNNENFYHNNIILCKKVSSPSAI